jgi:hypothetical protein
VDEKRDTYQSGLGERHEPGIESITVTAKRVCPRFRALPRRVIRSCFRHRHLNWSPVVNVPPPLTTTRATNHRCDQRKRASRPDDRLPPDFVTFAATFGIAFFVAFFVVFFAAALATRGRS